ncbi:MAG: hypothetical protein ABSC41_05320 [Acidimicrobiales bacterium]|jgi:alpha-beta hydrolase superfamily lysophospholipase
MKATPTWFGPPERPLFGCLHCPDGGLARGTVVMCGPLGREFANAQPAMQALSDQLAGIGVAALRFAYAGTGDSAGDPDGPGRVSDWLASVDEAVSFARRSSEGPVVLLGMRMGALLAIEAVTRGTAVDHLIAWDPWATGREFLRVERTLLATGYGAPQADDGSVIGPAFTYSAETVADLSALKLAAADFSKVHRALVTVRSEGRGLAAAHDGSPAHVDVVEVDGQPDLLDVPPQMITLPATTIKTIADWTSHVLDGPETPFAVEPVASAEVGLTPDGRAITERAVWLGPNSLFGMVTEPATVERAHAPTVVFLSAGALDHTGAGRMWVELARRFAGHGLRSIRFDIDGVGETFGRPDLARQEPKPPEAIDDLCDLAEALGDPQARDLIFVGLSSGGYHAIEGGLRLHPLAVCAINPGITGWVPDIELGTIDSRRLAYRAMPPALRDLSVKHSRVAMWTWQALCQVRVTWSPIHPVAGVSRRGIPVLVIVSEVDAHEFEPSLYWSVVRRRLRRRRTLDIAVVPGNDHSLYTVEGRAEAYPLLTRWVLSRFGDSVTS